MSEPLRAMMIGAHPDDVDICTCGITKRLVSKGCIVRFVSMTTGNAGHQTMRGEELIKRARQKRKKALPTSAPPMKFCRSTTAA